VIAFVAQSVNQVIHGRRVVPSTSTSTGAWTWSVSHTWLRHPRGRARNTSCLRAARSPAARPARSPGSRSRWIALCKVGSEGTYPGGDCRAARATSSRWTAATFPFHNANRCRTSGVTVNRVPACSREPVTTTSAPSLSASANHRHTARSPTPSASATTLTCREIGLP
jgi:hypothetical protein